jgi:hypothetical protein
VALHIYLQTGSKGKEGKEERKREQLMKGGLGMSLSQRYLWKAIYASLEGIFFEKKGTAALVQRLKGNTV